MTYQIFTSLLSAHILGDFYFQNDAQCLEKKQKKQKSLFLYVHSIMLGLLSWVSLPFIGFWWCALIIAFSHFAIDLLKSFMPDNLKTFVTDQMAHLAILCAISLYISKNELNYISLFSFMPDIWGCGFTDFAVALLLCLKPSNILIKKVLERYSIGNSKSCEEIKDAGALIGNLERVLTFILVVFGQFEAVGFVVAAKSILRFKETDTAKTEYVLAGTFLSFGIAVILGICVRFNNIA